MDRLFVVLSGLPGSGKTSLGRSLSPALGLPLLDKDDVLEALFDSLGVTSTQDRSRLSRASDDVLEALARASCGAVLSSFWRRRSLSALSGTPTEWLRSLPQAQIVEVLCVCPPVMAAERYQGRRRHAGHLDELKAQPDLVEQFERLAAEGPLGLGPLVKIDTTTAVTAAEVAHAVLVVTRRALSAPSL